MSLSLALSRFILSLSRSPSSAHTWFLDSDPFRGKDPDFLKLSDIPRYRQESLSLGKKEEEFISADSWLKSNAMFLTAAVKVQGS